MHCAAFIVAIPHPRDTTRCEGTKKGIRRTGSAHLLPGLHLLAAADDITRLCAITGFIDGNNKPADFTGKLVAPAFPGRFGFSGLRRCFCCLCDGLGRWFRCRFSGCLLCRLWRCLCAFRPYRLFGLGLCGRCRRCFCLRWRFCHFLITPLTVSFFVLLGSPNPCLHPYAPPSRFLYATAREICPCSEQLDPDARRAFCPSQCCRVTLDATDQIHLTRGHRLRSPA